jgi:geranylgeranyl diphosphate synthase type II
MNIQNYLKEKRELINEAMDKYLPPEEQEPSLLSKAMRYSVFSGGKRLRPILVLATYELIKKNPQAVLRTASAIEFIHTSSLILDDLPSMDDAKSRRSDLTTHIIFGEEIAILSALALLTYAFELMAKDGNLRVIEEVARALSFSGMIAGQVVDLESEGGPLDLSKFLRISTRKTGSIFIASARAGALLAQGKEKEVEALSEYARKLALAYQIRDDILDQEEDKKKLNFASLCGVKKAEQMVGYLVKSSVESLKVFGPKAELLRHFAEHITKVRK